VKLMGTKWVASVAFGALAAVLIPMGSPNAAPFAADAQNMGYRVVAGFVSEADAHPVDGATVFLKDLKSKNIRSYTSASQGHFRFASVNMADEQELWAEKDGKKSAVKSITPWDTSKEIEVELKLK